MLSLRLLPPLYDSHTLQPKAHQQSRPEINQTVSSLLGNGHALLGN